MGGGVGGGGAEGGVALAARPAEGLRILDPLPPCGRAVPRRTPSRAIDRRTRGRLPLGGTVPHELTCISGPFEAFLQTKNRPGRSGSLPMNPALALLKTYTHHYSLPFSN